MVFQLDGEQAAYTLSTLTNNTYSMPNIPTDNSNYILNRRMNDYELHQSNSFSFFFSLLLDKNSILSKSEIIGILNSFSHREENLPFSIDDLTTTDCQGIAWPPGSRDKSVLERSRVGRANWFEKISEPSQIARMSFNINSYETKTSFYHFYKYFAKLKLHETHVQAKNLVCCGSDLSNGIFYSSNHCVENILAIGDSVNDGYQPYFKINRIMPDDQLTQKRNQMKVDCLVDSRSLLYNSNSRISTMACTNNLIASGTFNGGYILQKSPNLSGPQVVGEFNLTNDPSAIINHISINHDIELIISSNDKVLRVIDIPTSSKYLRRLPFSVNCSSVSPHNQNQILITGNCVVSFIIDKRMPITSLESSQQILGNKDYGFSCDWSPTNENLFVTGNQDSSVKLWDKRNTSESMYSWDSALGHSSTQGGPVKNCKFSCNGDYLSWAEGLDHVGILQMTDLLNTKDYLSRIQSIDFFGKCTGLSFAADEYGHGENLIIGVNDYHLGGILNFKLPSNCRSLDFDFNF